jgi:hypothetical protein
LTPITSTPIHRIRFLQKVYIEGEWKAELRPEKRANHELAIEPPGGGLVTVTVTKANVRRRYQFAVANVQEIEFAPESLEVEKPKAAKKA